MMDRGQSNTDAERVVHYPLNPLWLCMDHRASADAEHYCTLGPGHPGAHQCWCMARWVYEAAPAE